MKPIGYIRRETLETLKDGISVNAIISATEFAGMVPVFSEAKLEHANTLIREYAETILELRHQLDKGNKC